MAKKEQLGARHAALETLERFRREGTWSGAGIDSIIKKYRLDHREAALASRLCLGVLQNSDLCDFYIGCYCGSKLEPKIRDILRLGVYQILFMDKIPDRAAVNESVTMCRDCGYGRASGLVNAVLRKISDNKSSLPDVPGAGTAKYLSTKYSHPVWLAQYMIDRRGYDFAEDFLNANNSKPQLTIQVNRLKVSVEDYAKALARENIAYRLIPELPGCIELEGGNATELPGFEDGFFYVQDRAARLAIEIAAPEPGMRVLDACSCPGGKSFAAAIAMNNSGSILSCDIHDKKLNLVCSSAERLGIKIIQTQARDAREKAEAFVNSFDLVIADVPCSGLGVIRKKPEIRNKSYESLLGLPSVQKEILYNLADFVKPGGRLLYSTCTILKEENESVISEFLNTRADYSLEGFRIADIDCDSGMYTFWPNVDGTDGFFAARLVRKR